MLRTLLVINIVLVVTKTLAGRRTGSLAVIGGAIDSGVDTLTTLIALALARVAAQEADELHPYGHAKFETLGALAMVAFLSITVYELIRGAIERLRGEAHAPVDTTLAVWVMTAALVVGFLASVYEHHRGVALRSELLIADAAHLRADVYVTVAVLAGLLLTRAGVRSADGWTTLLVAGLIARTGWGIIRAAVPVLVDERAVEAAEIARLAADVHGVHAVYDVRSRGREGAMFAELTIAVGSGIDVRAAHDIADQVEMEVREGLRARAVIVHIEPLDRTLPETVS